MKIYSHFPGQVGTRGLIFIIMNTEEVGQIVRERRKKLGLDQRSLAELAGVSTHTVSDVESGKGNPTLATVEALLEVLGLELVARARQIDGPRSRR